MLSVRSMSSQIGMTTKAQINLWPVAALVCSWKFVTKQQRAPA